MQICFNSFGRISKNLDITHLTSFNKIFTPHIVQVVSIIIQLCIVPSHIIDFLLPCLSRIASVNTTLNLKGALIDWTKGFYEVITILQRQQKHLGFCNLSWTNQFLKNSEPSSILMMCKFGEENVRLFSGTVCILNFRLS